MGERACESSRLGHRFVPYCINCGLSRARSICWSSVWKDSARQDPALAAVVARWTTVPGVDRVAAWSLAAEIGIDMEQFPTAAHLASWAGLCPGNCKSAGKRLSGKTRNGSPWLGRMACQCAWAAARTKNTYLSTQFRRLAAKRGRKRAIIAVAHSRRPVPTGCDTLPMRHAFEMHVKETGHEREYHRQEGVDAAGKSRINVCPKDLWQLSDGARRTLRRLRRRSRLIAAFWKQSSLFV